MKPRHAVALALVGWYLMPPAQAPDETGTAIAAPSPVAGATSAVYKSQQDCETERHQLLEDPVVGERMKSAMCLPTIDVPADDPRLKGN
jgi:hypothetical protein